jgi:hypothetical protein
VTDLVERIAVLHDALEVHQVPHAFGGALALAWCTQQARGTIDIDVNVFVAVDHADDVLAVLPAGIAVTDANRAEIARDGQSSLWWDGVPVDVFFDTTEFTGRQPVGPDGSSSPAGRCRSCRAPTWPCSRRSSTARRTGWTCTRWQWPRASTWRSGYYEVVLTIDVDGKRREPRLLRRAPARRPLDEHDPAGAVHQHLARLQRLRGPQPLHRCHHVSLQRPMARGYLHKPPGAGRRVTVLHPPDPEMNAHVGYLRSPPVGRMPGRPGGRTGSNRSWRGPSARATASTCAPTPTSRTTRAAVDGYRLLLSVGHDEYWSGPMRDTVEGSSPGGNVAFFSGNTSFWQVRWRTTRPRGPPRRWWATRGSSSDDPCSAPTGSAN